MTKRAAGWYRDPDHPRQHRYWDGDRWTAAPGASPEAEPGSGSGAAEEQAPS